MEWVLPLLSRVNNRLCSGDAASQMATSSSGLISVEAVIAKRRKYLGGACTMFYAKAPLFVSAASKQYVFDEHGHAYLDCISNVQHVGHCHPSVREAVSDQMARSNCNLRFLDPSLGELLERLVGTLPNPLDTVYMVNSGSESNDLALRLARESNSTGATEVIVVEHQLVLIPIQRFLTSQRTTQTLNRDRNQVTFGVDVNRAYHGHLTSTIGFSPYKFDKMGPSAKSDFVHVAPSPNVFSGKFQLPDAQLHDAAALRKAALQYAAEVQLIIENIERSGKRVLMFIMEALISCGGQILPPPGYLDAVASYVRQAGGLVVLDEVQTGFGRAGSHFWAWQTHAPDFVPDIVTMGKPMGNGFPVSAVATTRDVAAALGKHVMYFNTFGGNPVSCAAGLAVLNVLEQEKLQEHAHSVGQHFLHSLRKLQKTHPRIGDVRGVGLFLGIELVTDKSSRTPATQLAADVILALRQNHNILLSAEGPNDNVIKIKPPMCFSHENVDEVCDKLDRVLTQFDMIANGEVINN